MKHRPYFAGFDVLRFYAALSVVVWHVNEPRLPERAGLVVLFLNGNFAVLLFFVLSGFLITHLLLDERARTGHIELKAFYRRRVLRIWPLYFVVLLMAAVVFYRETPWTTLLGFSLFLGNFSIGYGAVPAFGPLWSIGLEEQFYFAWGFLMTRLRGGMPFVLVGAMVTRWLLVWAVGVSGVEAYQRIANLNRFDALAVGCLAAWLYHHARLDWLYRAELLWWGLMVAIVVLPLTIASPLTETALAMVFACLLLCVGTKPAPRVRLPAARSLGNLSFGIYLWHYPIMTLIQRRVSSAEVEMALVLILSITAAVLSYRFIEAPFLRLKDRRAALITAAPTGD